jgi:hypothetical protein
MTTADFYIQLSNSAALDHSSRTPYYINSMVALPDRTELPGDRETPGRPKPVFQFSVSQFLAILILNILMSPFVDRLSAGSLIETILITLVLLSALLSIAGGGRALVGVARRHQQ